MFGTDPSLLPTAERGHGIDGDRYCPRAEHVPKEVFAFALTQAPFSRGLTLNIFPFASSFTAAEQHQWSTCDK
jgi:hypothetical protein